MPGETGKEGSFPRSTVLMPQIAVRSILLRIGWICTATVSQVLERRQPSGVLASRIRTNPHRPLQPNQWVLTLASSPPLQTCLSPVIILVRFSQDSCCNHFLLAPYSAAQAGEPVLHVSGRSSGVEHNLAKVGVGRSNRLARSSFQSLEFWSFSHNPTGAHIFLLQLSL